MAQLDTQDSSKPKFLEFFHDFLIFVFRRRIIPSIDLWKYIQIGLETV